MMTTAMTKTGLASSALAILALTAIAFGQQTSGTASHDLSSTGADFLRVCESHATSTESALRSSAAGAPRPITPEAQMAYQKFLIRAHSLGIPTDDFPPVLTDESDLDRLLAEYGTHKQAMADAAERAKTQEAAGKAAAHLAAFCMAYVAGVVDGAQALAIHLPKVDALPFCFPPEVDNWQLYKVVADFLKAHPEQGGTRTPTVVVNSLTTAFPCSARP